MADLYRMRVLAREPELVVRVWLDNVQAADLPAKPNVALQFATDAFKHLNEFPTSIIEGHDAHKLLVDPDRAELARLDALLEAGSYSEFVAEAAGLVAAIEIVGEANWETVEQWEAECHEGGGSTPAPSIDYSVQLSAAVPTAHLTVGLEWTSPMFDRDE